MKRLGGSSVARIAGNILSGMLANSSPVPMENLKMADEAWRLALHITRRADAYDEAALSSPMEPKA